MMRTPEAVVQRIRSAFRARSLPDGDPIFLSHSFEVDAQTIERLARQTTWTDFPRDVLRANPLALAFMPPAAFAWLLPAYLLVAIELYSETDTLTTTLLTCLTPPAKSDAHEFEALEDEMRDLDPDLLLDASPPARVDDDDALVQLFTERVAALTPDEKEAIRDYLEYVDAVHGADFPVCGPRHALDRYWGEIARAGEGER